MLEVESDVTRQGITVGQLLDEGVSLGRSVRGAQVGFEPALTAYRR